MSHKTVYAIASGKGGVGKTTTTVNLGTALAQAEADVVIVDTDLGMANLAGFISLTPTSKTLHDVLSDEIPVEDATYRITDTLCAVPSGGDLDTYAATTPEGLGDVIETLRENFEYVLLDVGAGVSHESVLPLALADAVLLVSTPEPAAITDSKKTLELTERANGSVEGLILTRTQPSEHLSPEEIAARVGLPLLGTVPEDDAVRESVYAGVPLVVNDPDSPAATAYQELASKLAGRPEQPRSVSATPESEAEAEQKGHPAGRPESREPPHTPPDGERSADHTTGAGGTDQNETEPGADHDSEDGVYEYSDPDTDADISNAITEAESTSDTDSSE